MRLFTDPGHAILLAVVVTIVLAVYLVRRRRRNAGHHLDQLDGDDHQHQPGHGPADPERRHL